jgi:putative flavoprotein involved in K+ transport
MKLYGPATRFEAGKVFFAPKLRQHLDHADDVYRSINRGIDAHIEKHGIEAPAEAEYVAVWEPAHEPSELDLAASGISAVVWATGFHTDFSWVELPVFDARGKVEHYRGVTAAPGLYFLGLPWLHTWGSGRFSGVKTDAEYLLARISQPLAVASAEREAVPAVQERA